MSDRCHFRTFSKRVRQQQQQRFVSSFFLFSIIAFVVHKNNNNKNYHDPYHPSSGLQFLVHSFQVNPSFSSHNNHQRHHQQHVVDDPPRTTFYHNFALSLSSNNNNDNNNDKEWNNADWLNGGGSSSSSNTGGDTNKNEDWQEMLAKRADGTFWSSFETNPTTTATNATTTTDDNYKQQNDTDTENSSDQDAEMWLNTLASLAAEEIQFNQKEGERADTARRMAEWGFEPETISNTLGIATNTKLETIDDVDITMQQYRVDTFTTDMDIDLTTVESHTTVEMDVDTGEPARLRMVYVDEHTCIGCTNCAMIAQSTFFMHPDHGRARVFQQWGDDDETIQIAIETCPVDCIHYIPYEELQSLEIDRRKQNINFKARLVSQGEYGNSLSHRVGGANAYTAPQQISGNMGSRCNNCPTRGCKKCPMYGVGNNPMYKKLEQQRSERIAKRKLQKEREMNEKSIDL